MPKLQKKVDKICFHCKHYLNWWKQENPQSLKKARCLFWDKIFPDLDAWAYNPERKKPGDRTCKYWKG